jgi:hypothetical protein
MFKDLLVAFWLLSCVFVAGCTNVTEGPAPGVRVNDPRAPYATIRYNTVVFIDKSLGTWPVRKGEIFGWPIEHKGKRSTIAVESQGWRKTETGTCEIWATFRNRTDYPLQLECRVQFFDLDKAPIEGPTAWQRVFLAPNSVASYKEKSTRLDVSYYYTEVREGR